MVHEVVGGDAAEVAARKRALRGSVRAARAELTAAQRHAGSSTVVDRLVRLRVMRRAREVVLYAAYGDEVDVVPLASSLRERGTSVCFPRVAQDQLQVVACSPLQLRPGFRGLAEPDGPARPLDRVDVVVVPGLAFDPSGVRLGQGGGHYDRLLGRLPASTVRIGVGFACQLVPHVPALPHDEPVDLVVTDRVVHVTGARPAPAGG